MLVITCMNYVFYLCIFAIVGSLILSPEMRVYARDTEEVRVMKWNQLYGDQWPPQSMLNRESPMYTEMLNAREAEIMELTGADEKWENWLQHTQGRMVHNFTALGFEVVQTPPEVHSLLLEALNEGLNSWDSMATERNVDVIYHPEENIPKFYSIGELAHRVHETLLPYHEAWAGGIKLIPTSAYGLRLYRNGSSLVMHFDKVKTHVISSIVHISHEYDNDSIPWPLDIEGLDGKIYSLSLQPGQMAFYESSKCLHGRMSELRGKYYGK